jgi:hypothetical protein
MMVCERCKRMSVSIMSMHDYCAVCGKNLCDHCMRDGCCDNRPAISGMSLDDAEPDETVEANEINETTD